MKPLRISGPQWSGVGAQLMKARTRDRLEGRVRASFGGEVEQKCLDRSRCFADQQLVAAVCLALNAQHSWHVFGKLMRQPEQCGRLTALKLKFDFKDSTTGGPRRFSLHRCSTRYRCRHI